MARNSNELKDCRINKYKNSELIVIIELLEVEIFSLPKKRINRYFAFIQIIPLYDFK